MTKEKVFRMGNRATLKEVFKHRGRVCVVLEMNILDGFHNGYVEMRKSNYGKGYVPFISRIKTDELTFAGKLVGISSELEFLGFDSAHSWNDQRPSSKTFDSVKKRTKELAEEMVNKGI